MRDPVKRVWSYYQMVLKNPSGFPYKRFADYGLECFLKHCWEVRNMACRYYSGNVKHEPNTKTLDKALNNLMHFSYVLAFDNFESEAAECLDTFNIQMSTIPHEKKGNYTPCNQDDYDLIHRYNRLDMELFAKWKEQSSSHSISD